MARDDGREYPDRITEQNRKSPPDEVVYECHERSSPDGVTWRKTDDEGNSVIYNPDGDDIIVGNICDESSQISTYFASDKKSYPIINIVSRMNDRKIIADPDYKRGLVWDSIRQSRFVESILPIPPFFFELDYGGRWHLSRCVCASDGALLTGEQEEAFPYISRQQKTHLLTEPLVENFQMLLSQGKNAYHFKKAIN